MRTKKIINKYINKSKIRETCQHTEKIVNDYTAFIELIDKYNE